MTTANNHVHPAMAAILNGHAAACTTPDKRPVAPVDPVPHLSVPPFPADIEALQEEIEHALPRRDKYLADKFAEKVATWAFSQGAAAVIGGGK